MNGRITGSIALAAFVLFAGASALAQDTPAAAPSAAPATPSADTAAPAPAVAGVATAAPASSAAPKSTGVVTGYAYHEHGAPSVNAPVHHAARLVHHANEATAKVSGFEMLGDGGSRLFVQLSRQVDVDQGKDSAPNDAPRHGRHGRAAKQSPRAPLTRLTYVLKGTELSRSNDANSLETMHFNTPVVRARLLQAGRDLRFVILLRADVTPTMKVVATKDNGAMLQIDFPQGSYVTHGANASPDPAGASNEPANGMLPSTSQGSAPADTSGSGDTNDSTGPQ